MANNEEFIEINPEYVYITIPAEYICIYHRILVMLADYGIELIKDCKASCTNRNVKVIECFNMFNAAVAARKLNKEKEASLLINYVKAQLDLLYNGKDNSPYIVYPVDEKGEIKAIVGCGSYPKFMISSEDGQLYENYINNMKPKTFDFKLGEEDTVSE